MEKQPLQTRYKIWIETLDGKGVLGDGKWKLLKAIQKSGSLKLAFEGEQLSYRKTWNNLRKIEAGLGFDLISTNRGGKEKGGASLTPEALAIMEAFEEFHREIDPIFQKSLQNLSLRLNQISKSTDPPSH